MMHRGQVAFRKGRVTRQSLIIAPNSGINTFTQVRAAALLLLARLVGSLLFRHVCLTEMEYLLL